MSGSTSLSFIMPFPSSDFYPAPSLPKQIQPTLHIPTHSGGRVPGHQSEMSRDEWGRGDQLPFRSTDSLLLDSCEGGGKINLIGKGHGTEVGQWCRKTSLKFLPGASVSLDWHRGKGLQATPVNEPTLSQQESKFSRPANQVFLGPRAKTN